MAEEGETPQWVAETKATLGTLIKRPKLTDQLLQKPPFRFLHDIVTEVTKATGFAAGLYEGEELKSASIKDKDTKVAYLSKIIKCVEVGLKTQISIRAGKVVAGLEPENTNAFLQLLFQAATTLSEDQSNAAVREVLASAPPPAAPEEKALPPPMDLPQSNAEPSAFSAADFGAPAPAPAPAPDKEPLQMMSAPTKKPEEEPAPLLDEPKGRVRPKSARRAPPKLNNNEVKVEKKDGAAAAKVIMEGDAQDEEEMIVMVDSHNAGPGDTGNLLMDAKGEGHGKLVRNLLDAKAEMELPGNDEQASKAEENEAEQGIILGAKGGKAAGASKLPSKVEISALQKTIQTLCQASNPLGRCLEYVQEDLEAMGKELETWRQLRRRRANALAEEEAATTSALAPLTAELTKMDVLVKEKLAHIRHAKASIIRNDATIEQLLANVVRT
ncbi:hypothetical protein AB1Y20_009380 [Prymnesium parvum]|uniref:TRAF3-interacting protein 1 n=1 Tax=Prymnesium parvum TaxID=97485 RepID=A0AB34K6D4_PRYPA